MLFKGLRRSDPVYLLGIQSAGDFIDRDADNNVVFDTRKLESPLPIPLNMWKGPEAPHSVENLSANTPIRSIRVELNQN